jgi:succinate dehydrogenase / fumarate reductase flavoprotein subunit
MSRKLGIFREADKMKEGLLELKKMQKKISQSSISNKNMAVNQALVRFLELEYMLQLAQCVADGALKREESRGSHKRTDYPDRDDEKYLKHTITSLKDAKITVSYKPVSLGIFEPKERVY